MADTPKFSLVYGLMVVLYILLQLGVWNLEIGQNRTRIFYMK
jgi:hypothetical protein